MLARRFAIVCLLLTLFGMVFASLAAGKSHHQRDRSAGCAIEHFLSCLTATRR